MPIKELLFTFHGRIGRKTFWLWNIFYYFSVVGLTVGISTLWPVYSRFISPVLLLLILIPDIAVTAKRWHDRNRSSWYLLLNIPIIAGRMMTPAVSQVDLSTGYHMSMQMVISGVAVICGLWILIECGFLKGTEGGNRYGEAPLIS